jgi:hypothetical protein
MSLMEASIYDRISSRKRDFKRGGVQLVDMLEELQPKRKEIEDEIAQTKEKLIAYSEREGTDRIFGSANVARIKKET